MFWRNAGGYPVWLRDTVATWFLPLFMLQLTVLTCGTLRAAIVRRWGIGQWISAPVFLLCWILLGAAGMQSLANNVANWFSGRPIHSHPESRQP